MGKFTYITLFFVLTNGSTSDCGESGVDEPLLAQRINFKITLLKHHIKPLIDKKMVYEGYLVGSPSYYAITQKGISVLVELGILK